VSNIDRIRTQHHTSAMVAPDTFFLIAQRIERILSHGRTFAAAHTYATYTGQPPKVYPNLSIDRIRDGHGMWIACGTFGFGIDIDGRAGDTCEADVWRRFHNGRHEADRFDERRRNMTEVTLTGGREHDDPSPDDQIVIRRYNSDGVCDEKVIAFEPGEGSW
jgi:hypothetical protein